MKKRQKQLCFVLGIVIASSSLWGFYIGRNQSICNDFSTPHISENKQDISIEIVQTTPTYYADYKDFDAKEDSIDSYYIADRLTGNNHYFIKDDTLWGTGLNQYWQLGLEKEQDRNEVAAYYEEPIKIAEHVIHVDASENGYFVVYLTKDHKLYGLGANTDGVLLQPIQEFERGNYHRNITATPVLLMEHVLFASAGRESISILTEKGEIWWWGGFHSTTATSEIGEMYSSSPMLMVNNAKYTACGADFAAAIDQDNNLWTWGNNVWGQCGISLSKDYIVEPIKVCEQVTMVWPEILTFKQNLQTVEHPYDINPYREIIYPYTLFIKKQDGNFYAAGINLGKEQKEVYIYGDISSSESDKNGYEFSYSPDFVEINIIQRESQGVLNEK